VNAPVVSIRAIANGGDGVGTLEDGRTVFVPRTAVGDTVRLRDLKRGKSFARAHGAEIVTPGPGRVTPPCPHYDGDRCGSCQLMHLDGPTQRAAKARIVGDALRRIGKLELADPEVIAAPHELGYRAKVTFTWDGARLGYHRLGQAEQRFSVRRCLLAEPALQSLHEALRRALEHLPSRGARVTLRSDATGARHVIVRTEDGPAWTGGAALHDELVKRGEAEIIWWHPTGGAPRAVAGSDNPWPATVFEQVHPAMGRMVREAAIEAAGEVAGRHAWDLYAGIGDTTRALVARGATVDSVESDRRAVALAEQLGPAGPARLAAMVEQAVITLRAPDVIVTNPPREGMAAEACAILADSAATRLVYVACDPATLARDLHRMAHAWQLAAVQAFDQFPQTAHVECVATLERR
jgi:tRNA/tmRNA/rRNA uracil-C5-methylase (TrmA/RlmC/RlmD family)